MSARHRNDQCELLEQGDIFLLDWPETKDHTPEGLPQPQCFYLLIHPLGWCNHRLIHIRKKSRGQDGAHYSGVVDEIVRSNRSLSDHFAAAEQETKRYSHPPLTLMRLVGMGEYQLVRDDNHTTLAYDLVPPQECEGAAHDLPISFSYIIGVKNPELEEARQSSGCYAGHGYINADPVDLLNQEGAELLLINRENRGKR